MSRSPLWLRLSVVYSAISFLLLLIGELLPPIGLLPLGTGFVIGVIGLEMSAPGAAVISWFLGWPKHPDHLWGVLLGSILLTWIFVILPLFWFFNRCLVWLSRVL